MGRGEWARDEFLVTLDLYLNDDIVEDESDPKVQETAELIGRTPAAVVYRLGNYRHLDPEGTKGLKSTGGPLIEIWEEFYGNESELRRAAEGAQQRLANTEPVSAVQTAGEPEIENGSGEDTDPDTPVSTDEGVGKHPTRRGQ